MTVSDLGVAGFCVFVWAAWELISRLFVASADYWETAWQWVTGLFGG